MQPWKLAKQLDRADELRDACSVALNLYRQIAIYLYPVLPALGEKSAELFGGSLASWELAQTPLSGARLAPFRHLMARVDPRKVQALIAASVEPEPAASSAGGGAAPAEPKAALEPFAPECSFDDFTRVDLRVARVVAASEVPGSRKLVELRVSLGDSERTIFAGIRAAYAPDQLLGRLIVVVANLPPRTMKCGTSEGMALAAGPGGAEVFLLAPDSGARPGQRIH
jgi:methionyl-tRNA synthetase